MTKTRLMLCSAAMNSVVVNGKLLQTDHRLTAGIAL
jgi:hypothetical protein